MPSIGVNLRVTGHCSQGGRKYMEDFFSVAYQQSLSDERDLEYAFIGIYDGHGGAEAATYAKEHLINSIVNQKLFWSSDDQDVLRAIREGYIATHYAMWREQGKWPKTASGLPSTAGTTASVAFIRHGKIYIGHVGDSGIVLGYQNENERVWRAKPLTIDHKPESHVEKARIIKSGGKVVNKAGVPRVVWNRPRIGHKGPVRRSTPIDEIPFLAVARSLGDLWSYNSEMDEFVVSPEPDVRVVKIDPKRFKCLVFGTDGLWNVVSSQAAIDCVRYTETLNERNAYEGESKEWVNPSKYLVDKALERWSTRRMRADNTSVVIIMLDPPGPPKRDVLKSSASAYSPDYIEEDVINQPAQALEIEPIQNFTMFDHSTNEHIDMDGMPLPTSGLTVLTRYDNITESDVQTHNQQQQAYENAMEIDTDKVIEQQSFIDNFAGSYTFMNSNLDNDQYVYDNSMSIESKNVDDDSDFVYDESNITHQYNEDCLSTSESVYSLTKLQTRSEQQQYETMFASTSSSSSSSSEPIPSTSRSAAIYESYQQNLVDHNYVGSVEYDATSTPYSPNESHETLSPITKPQKSLGEGIASTFFSMMPSILRSRFTNAKPTGQIDANENIQETESIESPPVADHNQNANDSSLELNTSILSNKSHDHTIQINEISSSDNNESMSENDTIVVHVPRTKKHTLITVSKKVNDISNVQPNPARKSTRSATMASLSTARITRSTGINRKTRSVIISKKLKVKTLMKKSPIAKSTVIAVDGTRRVHKENIAEIVRKLPLGTINDCTMSRTKKSISTQQIGTPTTTTTTTSRTLRSQNALTKDQLNKANNNNNNNLRSSSTQNQNANNASMVAQASSSGGGGGGGGAGAGTRNMRTPNNSNVAGNAKGIVCKKLPKRLLNDSVQMNNKSNNNINNNNNSNRSQRLSSSILHGTNKKSTSTNSSNSIRWKMLIPNKSSLVANQLINNVNRSSITTRRTRFQQ